jgi:hypothetical protein
MSELEKLKKAAMLAYLTSSNKTSLHLDASGACLQADGSEPDCCAARDGFDALQSHVQLRAKHMSLEQLDALLEFYQSEMGVSILAAQQEVMRDFLAGRGDTIGAASSSTPLQEGNKAHDSSGWVLGNAAASVNASACSFCGDRPTDSRKLVAGSSAVICDECVRISCDILREQGQLI